jgi:hypothetical protein
MRNRLFIVLAVATGLLIVSVPLSAHHDNAAYDTQKKITSRELFTMTLGQSPLRGTSRRNG